MLHNATKRPAQPSPGPSRWRVVTADGVCTFPPAGWTPLPCVPGPYLHIVPSFRVPPCSEHLPWEEKTPLLSMRGQSSWCRRAVAPAPSLAAQPVPFSQLPRLGMVEEGRQLLTNPMKMAHLRAARGFLRPAAEEHMGVLMADFSLECLAPYCTAVKLKILVNGPAA